MNIRKFVAPTAREALREIRSELGEEAVILSNRKTELGVEIHAMANDEMMKLTDAPVIKQPAIVAGVYENKHVEIDGVADEPVAEISITRESLPPKMAQSRFAGSGGEAAILGEIKSMHRMLQKQIEALSWNNVQQRDPMSANLLRRMLNAGFSTVLARQLLDKMPAGNEKGETWIKNVLKRNLRVAGADEDVVVKGGVYALIGPTGVGKTTTTAKLAARAVVRYGADKVALLTTDSYRIGAYEQLKIYGKILGVAVHAVKGADDLRLTLAALRHKHLVLIDTVGMGQRDERVSEQSEMFDAAGVQRLLVLNATSGGDTLEDVVRMYHSSKVIGCIATKLDEAVNLGALLDVVVRHRLVMNFMANGQRVPEDLHLVNIDILLHRAFKAVEEKSPFTLDEMEFPTIMAGAGIAIKSAGEVAYAV
jgi:flagellar biosynthesis protein FlhF